MRSAICLGLAGLSLIAFRAEGGAFGRVTAVRGAVSDIAVDEGKGLVYAANYTANRVEAINIATGAIETSYPVAAQPSALALSVDGRFLVVTHASKLEGAFNGVTIMDLFQNTRRVVATTGPALTAAFGASNLALVVTTEKFLLLNPYSGLSIPLLEPVPGVVMEDMPLPAGTMPANVTWASSGVSGDGWVIYALVDTKAPEDEKSQFFLARLDLTHPEQLMVRQLTASPKFGPRVVSVDERGMNVFAAWGLLRWSPRLLVKAQLPNATGEYAQGGHAFDLKRNVIYAQATVAQKDGDEPTLHVMDAENLTVRERIRIPQALAGKSIVTRDGGLMVAVTVSGVTVFDLDKMWKAPRVAATQEDILFNGGFCDRRVVQTTLEVVDPSGAATDFSLSLPAGVTGVRVFPVSGTTPARVTVEVDPAAFANKQGTQAVALQLKSAAAVNVAPPVRLLVNTRDADQRGAVANIPGRLVEILADPYRPRFYAIRQDRNLVQVYNSATLEHMASLRTGNTPVQMTMTADAKYLVVGNDNSQYASVMNLETLVVEEPIELPLGLYPRSVATAGDRLLATARSASSTNAQVVSMDIVHRVGTSLTSLGIYCNEVHGESALFSSPTSGTVLLAQPGAVSYESCKTQSAMESDNPAQLLYETASNQWVAARTDLPGPLGGAYAALSDDYFLVDDRLLDAALAPVMQFTGAGGRSAGALGLDTEFFRVSATTAGPGYLERVAFSNPQAAKGTRLTEAPVTVDALKAATPAGLTGQLALGFTRTLSMTEYPKALLMLSVSGVTVMQPDFDAATAGPVISGVVNAADFTPGVAPGGLIRIDGTNLTTMTERAGTSGWPSILGGACVTVNSIPIPLARVSPTEVTGQLPFAALGTGAVSVRSPAGVSNTYTLKIQRTAPAVFRLSYPEVGLVVPMVMKASNGEPVTHGNPILGEDEIEVFFTGGGLVRGSVAAGAASPGAPAGATLAPCIMTLGEETLEVGECGLAAGSVGVYKARAKVPWYIKGGNDVRLTIGQGDTSTSVSVRVLGK